MAEEKTATQQKADAEWQKKGKEKKKRTAVDLNRPALQRLASNPSKFSFAFKIRRVCDPRRTKPGSSQRERESREHPPPRSRFLSRAMCAPPLYRFWNHKGVITTAPFFFYFLRFLFYYFFFSLSLFVFLQLQCILIWYWAVRVSF